MSALLRRFWSSNRDPVLQKQYSENRLEKQNQPNALELLNEFFDALPLPPAARFRRPPELHPRLALAPTRNPLKIHVSNVIAFATHGRDEQNRCRCLLAKLKM
jgi:hypothetical protein